MHILPATIDDLDRLQAIAKTTFSETFAHMNSEENMRKYLEEDHSSEKLRKELINENSSFYLAIENAEPIGYLKLNEGPAQSDLRDPDSLEIERIYLLKRHQGTHIGKALLDYALAKARAEEKVVVWLGVWERNQRAIAFYSKHGFAPFGTHIFRLADEDQVDILMKLGIG
jgi:ribosomal protein S18 acetylase RimI-like enzyme